MDVPKSRKHVANSKRAARFSLSLKAGSPISSRAEAPGPTINLTLYRTRYPYD